MIGHEYCPIVSYLGGEQGGLLMGLFSCGSCTFGGMLIGGGGTVSGFSLWSSIPNV